MAMHASGPGAHSQPHVHRYPLPAVYIQKRNISCSAAATAARSTEIYGDLSPCRASSILFHVLRVTDIYLNFYFLDEKETAHGTVSISTVQDNI